MSATELKFVVYHNRQYIYNVKAHSHPCYEIVYYISGRGEVTIGDSKYFFGPNTFAINPPSAIHTEKTYEGVELVYIGFEILDSSISLEKGLFSDDEDGHPIQFLMTSIKKDFDSKTQNFKELNNQLTDYITYKIFNKQQTKSRSEDDSFEYVKTFIHYNCMKSINCKTVAESIGYSYDYFRKLFEKHFNMSVKDFILKEKINYSLKLVEEDKKSINEIARLSGFSSPSHFIMCFKSVIGKTPKQYLISFKENSENI